MDRTWAAAAAALGLGLAGPAGAAELMAGVYAHDVSWLAPLVGSKAAAREGGADFQLGVRSDRIHALKWIGSPQAHLIVSANTNGTSDFVAAGVSWPIRITHVFYFRPGIGMAYTDGEAGLPPVNAPGLSPDEIQRRLHLYLTRIDFGSKDLFEPELNIGAHLTPKLSLEASWVHLSNGEILHHGKNQGLDDAGFRLIYKLGAPSR